MIDSRVFNLKCARYLGIDMSRIVEDMPVDKYGNYCNGNGDLDAEGTPCYKIWVHSLQYYHSWDHLMRVIIAIEKQGYVVALTGIKYQIYKVMDEQNPIISWVCGNLDKKLEITREIINEFFDKIETK